MEILVQPANRVVSLESGETLLQAMRRASLPISYSCEDGRCGVCRCRLLRGRVIETARPPRQSFGCRVRYVLACQSTAAEDCEIEMPDAGEALVHPPQRLRVRILGVETLSPQVRLLRLSNEARLAFEPGQCAEIELDRGLSRLYSISGLPGDPELRFHVRLHPNGRASHLIGKPTAEGRLLRLRGPYGAAWLRRQHAQPILCVAAGTGLGPLLSVLRGITEARMMNPVHVYAGFMSSEEIYGLNELAGVLRGVPNLRAAHVALASGKLERGQRRGLLTEVLAQDLGRLSHWRAHLYGSAFAVDATVQLLRRLGVAEEHLYTDAFQPFGN